jgi:hypothetical protein
MNEIMLMEEAKNAREGRRKKKKNNMMKKHRSWSSHSLINLYRDKPMCHLPKRETAESTLIESSTKKKEIVARRDDTRNEYSISSAQGAGMYDAQCLHSSARSKKCPFQEEALNERLARLCGKDYEKFVIKI